MNEATQENRGFSDREMERLMHLIHSSLEVRRRSQFFLWAQGQLQSFLPHEVMICANGDSMRRTLSVDFFASYPLPGQDVETISEPETGLMAQMARTWRERGEKPVALCNSDRDNVLYRRFEAALFKHAFPNFVIHGTPTLHGWPGAFFAFANLPQPIGPRIPYFLEVLTPFIHAAYLRMLGNEIEEKGATLPRDELITAREVEILQWVREGKSNQEIGHILSISPLTVKNHVQKILKKLQVQNRAQAVAKGISLQIIRSGPA